MTGLPTGVIFCLACGLPLNKELRKYNKKFTGPDRSDRKFCNNRCQISFDLARRRKNKPKYGVAGEIYF